MTSPTPTRTKAMRRSRARGILRAFALAWDHPGWGPSELETAWVVDCPKGTALSVYLRGARNPRELADAMAREPALARELLSVFGNTLPAIVSITQRVGNTMTAPGTLEQLRIAARRAADSTPDPTTAADLAAESVSPMPLHPAATTPATTEPPEAAPAAPAAAFRAAAATLTTPGSDRAVAGPGGAFAALAGELDRALADLAAEREARAHAEAERDDLRARPTIAVTPATPTPAAHVAEADRVHVPAPITSWEPTALDGAIASLCEHRVPLLLCGAPGLGKTTAIRQACANTGIPLQTFACNESADADAAVQRREIRAGETAASDGPLAWAARTGHAVTLDELGAMPPQAQAALHDWLAGGSLLLPWTGEALPFRDPSRPTPWVCATSNLVGSGRTDCTHEQQPTAALLDRFAILELRSPDEATEARTLLAMLGHTPPAAPAEAPAKPLSAPKGLDKALGPLATSTAKVLGLCRASWASGDLSGCYSPRRGAQLLHLLSLWGGSTAGQVLAWRAALIDRHPPAEREILAGIIQRATTLQIGTADLGLGA